VGRVLVAIMLVSFVMVLSTSDARAEVKKIVVVCPDHDAIEGTLSAEFKTAEWPMSCNSHPQPEPPGDVGFAEATVTPPGVTLSFNGLQIDLDRAAFDYEQQNKMSLYFQYPDLQPPTCETVEKIFARRGVSALYEFGGYATDHRYTAILIDRYNRHWNFSMDVETKTGELKGSGELRMMGVYNPSPCAVNLQVSK